MNTTEQLIDFLRENNGLEDVKISSKSKLASDLGLSSYDIVEMCCQLENMFGIEINETAVAKFDTVGDMADYISAEAGEQPTGSLENSAC